MSLHNIMALASSRIKFSYGDCFLCRKYIAFYWQKRKLTENSSIRVRFAPSPTGLMHLGGLRTALFNKLFAVKYSGKFILRIEDTDKSRVQPNAKEDIIESLHWCGLTPDESPLAGGNYGSYIQSERRSLYSLIAQKLIDEGFAYRCFCSLERLNVLRSEQSRRNEPQRYDNRCRNLSQREIAENLAASLPYTIRFKTDDSPITVNDIVYGSSTFNSLNSDGDFIIMKSDGMPVYHLANVIDDHYMEISHVIRGVEWLTSTPKHLLLYKALNWSPPQFAHLPLLLSSSGGKLSKRSPEFSLVGRVRSLRKAGYLPSAVLNWLTSTGGGFSHDDNSSCKQIRDLEFSELVSRFELSNVSRHNAQLSINMLKICGQLHFDKAINNALDYCLTHQKQNKLTTYKTPQILNTIKEYLTSNVENLSICISHSPQDDLDMLKRLHFLKCRVHCLNDLVNSDNGFLFIWKSPDLVTFEHRIANSNFIKLTLQDILKISSYFIEEVDFILQRERQKNNIDVTSETVTTCLQNVSQRSGVKQNIVMHLIRLGLTGHEVGPPVVELIQLLSIPEAVNRISKLYHFLSRNCTSESNEAL
ncbi:putative glutamate--tRNA ligase isoform 2 [Schistosoma japonicum]|uniref:Nondiscriminating glutamyl-tRNA synthetase EARS2, mitochondrial n=3 Tax=Schistosoma japonicum TaxID=6182 RepID=A0A4Z2CX39_SCHJA|nr:putative glutamate--tRNA ligase isoform 2 [Schistosoma japonicum]